MVLSSQVEYFSKLPNTERFIFFMVAITVFMVITNTRINLSHVLGFTIIILLFNYTTVNPKNLGVENKFNETMKRNLDDIITYTKLTDQIYLHHDIDLVRILHNIKYNFTRKNTNYTTYKSIVYSANQFLKCKDLIFTKVCSGVKTPDLLKNWDGNTKFEINCNTYKRPENIKELFQEACKQSKLCLNYTHSLVINTVSNETIHAIHAETHERFF